VIDMKASTSLVIFAVALVCISSSSTALEPKAVDTNCTLPYHDAQDPLTCWNEGSAKSAILNFVANVTNKSNPDYVEPEERIAAFDNDGTLLCEYPDPVQVRFMLDRVKDMAPDHPEWNYTEPFSSILSGKRFSSSNFSTNQIMQIYVATSSNLTPEEYMSLARDWLNRSIDPHFGLPYTKCVYKPMLELLRYLRAKGFMVYIVTGGDADFVRAFSEDVYGIPPEQVIGSAMKLQFIANNSTCSVVKLPEILVYDDGEKKAEEIQLIIGRPPILAYGNCDGDIPMLEFATEGGRRGLGLLNHHDDPIREFAYDNDPSIGALDKGLKMAGDLGWQVVSMKNDWNDIF
jgi:phosphoserine phosphatase